MNWLVEPWTYGFMRWAWLACVALAGVHVYLGFHIVRRGVLFVDLAMAQAAALGAAVAIVAGLEHDTPGEYVFSAVFALAAAGFFATVKSRRIHQEAIVATFYALAVAATFVVLEHSPHGMEEVKHLFVGQVLTVAPTKVMATALLYALLGVGHIALYRRTLAVTDGTGRDRLAEFYFFGSFALVVTSSVALVGVLLVFALLVLPAVAALWVSEGRLTSLGWGWGVALTASLVGLHTAFLADMPAAPMIVLTLGVLLAVCAVVGRLRGRAPLPPPMR